MEFLNETKCCVLNGRFKNDDNFTSISRKEKAVVDYICIPHDSFKNIKSFAVMTIQSIVDRLKLYTLINEKSRLPDHSVLVCEFMVTGHSIFSRSSEGKNEQQRQTRFKLNCVPVDFMNEERNRLALLNIIEEIEACRETQINVDDIYNKLCNTIINEMNNTIPKLETKSAKKRFRHKIPLLERPSERPMGKYVI